MLYSRTIRSSVTFDTTSAAIHCWRQATLADGLITLSINQGDITTESTDVIVNPANSKMLHRSTLA